ncbi:MAG: agmatinase [candidate division Zixibacteria bacterium]|nr:agmatinase [candidate division Zixibacteria bacterium]
MPTGLKINCSDPAKAEVVLLCVPYDHTASFRKGTCDGPAAIVNSLRYQMETYDRYAGAMPASNRTVALSELTGINDLAPSDMVARVKDEYVRHLDTGAFVMMLGGEHSISTGAFQALASRMEAQTITVVQIDAHFDLRPDDSDYNDTPHGMYAHCTPMRRAHELGFNLVPVGIRAYSQDEMDYARKNGLTVFEWGGGEPPAVADIVKAIPTDQVYLTIDVDGFDPSCMPATGTPVPGGLDWYYGVDLIREVFARKQVVGADVVEVAPRPHDVVTEYGAAQLCYTMLALREAGRRSTD